MQCLILVSIVFVFMMCGCSEKKSEPELTESEISFNEKLASITKDEIEQNIFYIGTEDGIVYRYNSENNHIDTLKTSYDRIYKVYRSKDKVTYWIGTRNQGLVRCVLVGDSLFKEEYAYTIPARNKARKYSAYDIFEHGKNALVATSHGLFVVMDVADSAMHLLYPNIDKSKQYTLRPVVVNNIRKFDNRFLFCASDSGLLRYDGNKNIIDTCIHIKPVKGLEIVREEIRFHTDSLLYIADRNGKVFNSQPILHPANTFFYEKNEGINYLIADKNIQLIRDIDLKNPTEYKNIPLKYNVRASTCRNVIVDDVAHHQSLMVSEHSLIRIGHHQNIFNSIGKIDFACVDGNDIYYLIGSKLYRQMTDSHHSLQAEHLWNIKKKNGVSFMAVHNDTLYYVSADKKNIFKTELKYSFFDKIISDDETPLKNILGKEVTAIGKDGSNVYVGIRDGFQNVSHSKTIQLYSNSITRDTCPDPFITVMTDTLYDGEIILGTLNDGLFKGKGNKFEQWGDYKHTFIRDIAVDSMGKLYVLTNRKIYIYGAGKDTVVSKDVQGCNRLLIGSHTYGFKEYGIHDFDSGMDFFTDVQFNPQACVALNGCIYAGSGNGVYVFKELRLDDNGKELGFKTICFGPEKEQLSLTSVVFFFLLVVLFIILLYFWYKHYSIRKSIPTLIKASQEFIQKKEKEESIERIKARLNSRIQEQLKYKEFFDENISKEIDAIRMDIEELGCHEEKNEIDDVNRLNDDIQKLSFRIPTILNTILDSQLQRIKDTGNDKETRKWLDETDCIRRDTDIELKLQQIKKNSDKLRKIKDTETELMLYYDIDSIPKVTDKIISIIDSNEQIDDKLEQIEQYMAKVDKDEAIGNMRNHLTKNIEEVKRLQIQYDKDTHHYSILNSIVSDYTSCLYCLEENRNETFGENFRKFIVTDKRLELMKYLQELPLKYSDYMSTHNQYLTIERKLNSTRAYALLHEDEKERIKKKDKEDKKRLNIECQDIRIDIKGLINGFYSKLKVCPDQQLIDTLNWDHTQDQKKSDGQFMWEEVLALLLSGIVYDDNEYGQVLGHNFSRIRDTRSQKINERIKCCRKTIGEYAEKNPSSIAVLLLDIVKSCTKDNRM